jgi:hypothetical protein
MAHVARLERVLDDGYRGVQIGSELGVEANCGEDVL